MNQIVYAFLSLLLLAGVARAAAEDAHEPVAVVVLGQADHALIQRAVEWAAENLALPVPRLPDAVDLQPADFDQARDLAKPLLEANRLGLVVVCSPGGADQDHGKYYPEERMVVINLGAMMTPDTDAETVARRVERQVIRGICFAMGLEPNPNPQSAMFSYTTLEELDAIGRNLDPPWLMRLQEKALASGIQINGESSFNLVVPLYE